MFPTVIKSHFSRALVLPLDQSNASTYNKRLVILRKAKTNMADGVTQLCELCNRLRLSLFTSSKLRNMPPVFHLILASLTGVAVALIATYIPSIWRPWFWRPSLESYAPGFNLVLAPQTALVEKSEFISNLYGVLLDLIYCLKSVGRCRCRHSCKKLYASLLSVIRI